MGIVSEEWRPVIGYEGKYEVSDRGQVRSVDRIVKHYRGTRKCRSRIRKFRVNKGGYCEVLLCCPRKLATVHSLVSAAFIGLRPEGMQVNHIDGIKTNNSPLNLEYVTPLGNTRHAIATGLKGTPQNFVSGEGHCMAKLTRGDITVIRRKRSEGMTLRELAESFHVSHTAIRKVVTRETWKSS